MHGSLLPDRIECTLALRCRSLLPDPQRTQAANKVADSLLLLASFAWKGVQAGSRGIDEGGGTHTSVWTHGLANYH